MKTQPAKKPAARKPAATTVDRDAALLAIAKKHLFVETLTTRHGGLDFSEQAVWGLKAALEAAYAAGKAAK